MKHLVTIFLLLIGSHLAAQSVKWEKTYGSSGSDACQVVATPDGGLAVLAYFGINPFLLRTNANGDTLWTKRLPAQDFCTIITTQDGGFLTTGATRAQTRDFVAHKVDAFGDSLWLRTYPDSLDQGHYQVIETDDGGFLLTGYTRTPSGGYDMYVIRTDAQGGAIWNSTYGTAGLDLGAMPALNRSGGFGLVTTSNQGGPSGIFMVATDSSGNQLWSQSYTAPFAIGGAVLTALSDGGYLIMGWIQRSDYNSYLIRIDSAGNKLWERDYGGLGFETRTARGAVEDLQGGYTFVTSTDMSFSPGLDRDIALVRVDTAGNLMHWVRMGGQGEELPRYFQQMPDSGYVVTGYSSSFIPSTQQAYLGRLDSLGCGQRFYALNAPQRDTLCLGDTLVLDAESGFSSYLWSNGSTAQRLQVAVPDTYFVRSVDASGCIYHSSFHFVEGRPGTSFTFVDQGGLLVDFLGEPNDATSWAWNFGNGQTSALQNPSHQYSAPGTYQVCLTAFIPECGMVEFCDTVVLLGTNVDNAAEEEDWCLHYEQGSMEIVLRPPSELARDGLLILHSISGSEVVRRTVHVEGETRIPAPGLTDGIFIWRWQGRDGTVRQGKFVLR